MGNLRYHNTWFIFTCQPPTCFPGQCGRSMLQQFNKWHRKKKNKNKKTIHILTTGAMSSLVVCINVKTHDIRERNVTIRSEIWTKNMNICPPISLQKWQVAQTPRSSLKRITRTLFLICTSIIINHNASSWNRGSTLPPHFSWYAFSIRSAKVTPAQWQMNHNHPHFQQCYWSVEWFRGGHSFQDYKPLAKKYGGGINSKWVKLITQLTWI